MPRPWLAEKIAAGRRAAKPNTCRRCGKPVLAGPDDDIAALPAAVDPQPVDAATELLALSDGRASYNLIGGELCYRTQQWHVRYAPAGVSPHPVHLEHRCPNQQQDPA